MTTNKMVKHLQKQFQAISAIDIDDVCFIERATDGEIEMLNLLGFQNDVLADEVGIYSFIDVPEHIDNIYPPNFDCVILMFQGSGVLIHSGGEKYLSDSNPEFFAFNDRKPHSFKSNGEVCAALIFGVKREAVKAINPKAE